jgi:2-C-methyl-D-erythritol 4-phosphate cytidylyltransferase
MAKPKFGDASVEPARLPQWRSATVARSHGRDRPDWALIVPIPASVAANREVLFTHFGDTVPLVHCLQSRLVSGRRAAEAVIAVAESLYTDVEALLAAHGVLVTVEPVSGRGTRAECLSAGLARLDSATQYVLVHDIHRPLAPTDLADRILDGLRQGNDVVVPALAMVDSVKTVDSAGTVTETVDRARLWSAQFPRGFRREHLAAILDITSTCGDFDELIVARLAGVPPRAIEGDPDAFAIDVPRDVGLADAIYTCRLAEQR